MIDPKYTTKSLTVLSHEEKIREVTLPKMNVTIDLFTDDVKVAQSLNLNISRILRLMFHQWVSENCLTFHE